MIDKWRINVALPEKDLKYYNDAMISRLWQNFILLIHKSWNILSILSLFFTLPKKSLYLIFDMHMIYSWVHNHVSIVFMNGKTHEWKSKFMNNEMDKFWVLNSYIKLIHPYFLIALLQINRLYLLLFWKEIKSKTQIMVKCTLVQMVLNMGFPRID